MSTMTAAVDTIIQTFDRVVDGYDNPSMRFYPFCADALVHYLRPKPGSKVLDIATGTGSAAVAAAQSIGPQGRVQAIDLSERMIDKAIRNVSKMALSNVDFHTMDARQLEFKSSYFDAVMSSFGLPYLEQANEALHQWIRVLKPGGTLAFNLFAEEAFQPMAGLFQQHLHAAGIACQPPENQQLRTESAVQTLFENHGLQDMRIVTRQMGFHLNQSDNWWDILWNSSFRYCLDQLDEQQLGEFRQQHLDSIETLVTEKGLWLNIPVIFAAARKASSASI